MPYTSMEDVPASLKHVRGVPLTLDQINSLVRCADALITQLTADGLDKPEATRRAWAICISTFLKRHRVSTRKDGSKAWVLKGVSRD